MKIYQLVVKLDENDFVIGTFKNQDDALNGLADWTENYRALNEALESTHTQDEADAIMDTVPEIYHPWDGKAHVLEYDVLESYNPKLVKM
jgi:hypothetical protein